MRVAFFLDGAAGKVFCTGTLHPDKASIRGRVLIVPPLAEEMNKSRHLLAAIARAAGDACYDVILPDLFGTGDSGGDFADATLEIWRSDLDAAIGRMCETGPVHIIALRAGALLISDVLARHPVQTLTLLQPQTDGRQVLNQLLRLRLAGGLLAGDGKETATQLRQHLADGQTLETAGYALSGAMAAGLESLSLEAMPLDAVRQIHWLELVPQPDRPLMPVSQRMVDAWTSAGKTVTTSLITCDQFWATQEIAQCPAVVATVMQHLAG